MNVQIRPNAIRLYQLKRHTPESLKRLRLALRQRHGKERDSLLKVQEDVEFKKAEPLANNLMAASLIVESESIQCRIDANDNKYILLNERVVPMQQLFELLDYANVPEERRMHDAGLILLKSDLYGPTVASHILDALNGLPAGQNEKLYTHYCTALVILETSKSHSEFTASLAEAFGKLVKPVQGTREIIEAKPELVKRSSRKAVRKNATWQPGATAWQSPFGNNFARQCLHEFNIKAEFVALSLGNKVPEEDNARVGSQSQLLRSNMLDRIHNIYNHINGFEGSEQIPDLRNIKDFLNNLNLVVATAILFKHEMGDSPDAALTLSSMADSYFNDTSKLNKAMNELGLDQSLSGFACSMLKSYRHMKKERK